MDYRTSRVAELFCSQQQFQFSCLQRQNRWQTKHWCQFWDSVETLARDNGGSVGTHPLGTLIPVGRTGVRPGIEHFTVVDGQHRLIACSTLLAALRDWMRDHCSEMQALEIERSYLSHPFRSRSDAHKIVLGGDTPSHVSIISSTERADTPEWMLDAYDLFYKKDSPSLKSMLFESSGL